MILGVRLMIRKALCISVVSLLISLPVYADGDPPSGMPSGKRQHKPVTTAQPEQGTEEAATAVRKPMQDVKNAPQGEPAGMNKAELTETLAEKPPADTSADKRVSETLRHKDRNVAEKTDKSEAARSKKKDP